MAKSTDPRPRDAEALAALEQLGAAPAANRPAARKQPAELTFATPSPLKNTPRPRMSEQPPVPRWYRIAVPLLFSVGGLLVIIGLWALGAMVYMHTISPAGPDFEVQYPLIRWNPDLGDAGAYTPESMRMAAVMLACLPLAGLMGGMLLFMRRQMRVAMRGPGGN